MRLEGTLDAFSLPDIFQLLSYTKKTGTLHLRRDAEHGVVHLRDGVVTGARSDVFRQALGRRLVGAGLVDDEALAEAVAAVRDAPDRGLARALADTGRLDPEVLRQHGVEQATDAVFDLLRWTDGDFAFVMDELDPDDLGAALAVDDVVAEGRRRLESWDAVTAAVPSPAAVVSLAPSPGQDPAIDRDEWTLLSLVDGARTVADLVALSGRGEYVVVSALAALVERGLLSIDSKPAGAGALLRRQELLATLEQAPEAVAAGPPTRAVDAVPPERGMAPTRLAAPLRTAAIPERPEPFTPARQPDHVEPGPTYARPVSVSTASTVGAVQGAHALQLQHDPDTVPAASAYIDRDPSVNKSLLLRLIAGVRGL